MIKPIPQYRDLTSICNSCGFPVQYSRNANQKLCSLRRPEGFKTGDRALRSPCQMHSDRIKSKIKRAKDAKEQARLDKERGLEREKDEGYRRCLGRLCNDEGKDKFFWSLSLHNRICPRCESSKEASMPFKRPNITGSIQEYGIQRKFIPATIARPHPKD